MDAAVPLGTIQRSLGHHNISQTSKYLAASLGNDDDAMRAFEAASDRLTQIDVSASVNGPDRSRTDSETFEKTPEITIGPEQVGVVH
jgi:hypothetical protein